jgi:hypothetical protein
MKDLKHTPGPWEVVPIANFGQDAITDEGGNTAICFIPNLQKESAANKKLIVASPDLIKAALYAIDLLGHNDNNYAVGEGNIKDACKELEAAIKKAI